jgi:3-phosphoshikimate 1-carboxyvinyltransferase
MFFTLIQICHASTLSSVSPVYLHDDPIKAVSRSYSRCQLPFSLASVKTKKGILISFFTCSIQGLPNVDEIISRIAESLSGTVRVPGDKSISHRALMFGALAAGETRIKGLLEGEDVLATAAAMRALGSQVERESDGASGTWRVHGCGLGALAEPDDVLDMGNSGTAARLLMGLLATHPITTTMTGDASLRSRPMERVLAPLRQFGARFDGAAGGRLPMTVTGTSQPIPIEYQPPVASAQVKSAVLLAGLNTPGETTVIETVATRDHTERMLIQFGAEVRTEALDGGGRRITVVGEPELTAGDVAVPADISSAAFPMVAALLVPGSRLRLNGVGVNPLRAGLPETLREMGACIKEENISGGDGEPIADMIVEAGELQGIEVPAERAPSMIDEYPILAVAAACANGTTVMRGLAELRVKESDRLAAMAKGLTACGVELDEGDDSLVIHGTGKPPMGGATIDSGLDHRIAMAFLVLGMVSREPIIVTGAETINTSFPGFVELMNARGAQFGPAKARAE